jgi:hypothetical protein
MQTRDLLQLALAGVADKLPTSEKVFKRPPVRLLHDVGVALGHERKCFEESGGWELKPELLNYGGLSREQKVAFFEQLINNTNRAVEAATTAGLPKVFVTSQDILSGKNCEESNRLLQLLAYLSLFPGDRRTKNGIADVAPQWIKAWKLSYRRGSGGWKWYGAAEDGDAGSASVFDGNSDTSTVKLVKLPEPIVASKLRLYAVEWHQHAGLRCEVHVAPMEVCSVPSVGSGSSLEDCLTLVCNGIVEVRKSIEDRKQAKQRADDEKAAEVSALKDKAEQERDVLEKRLQEALDQVEELTQKNTASEQRASTIENELLQTQVDRDLLPPRQNN